MRAAGDEPEEFADYGAQEDALGGEEGEEQGGRLGGVAGGAREGELHLGREGDGVGSGASAVGAVLAIGEDVADEVEVLVFFVGGIGW